MFAYNGLPWGGGATAPCLTLLERSRRADVTLQLPVFEIFAVKWPNFTPKISEFWIPGGTVPKRGEDLSGSDM